MSALIECVPNFSEGRDRSVVEKIAAAVETVSGARVLDLHLDPDHNRSVITFAGPPEVVGEAAVRAVGEAAALIDLTTHRGVHPRIGAADVVPFVPLQQTSMEDCIAIAHRTGEQIFRRFGIPIYFYGAAALRPECRNLSDIRRGGFEKLRLEAPNTPDNPSRRPDLGGPALHATSGATVVGARPLLIAFNINLQSGGLAAARAIARRIRSSGGGVPALQAIGVLVRGKGKFASSGQAQISMNLTDFHTTSPRHAFDAVDREAKASGLQIDCSEIVGLIPRAAFADTSQEKLKIADFSREKILENRLEAAFGPVSTA